MMVTEPFLYHEFYIQNKLSKYIMKTYSCVFRKQKRMVECSNLPVYKGEFSCELGT